MIFDVLTLTLLVALLKKISWTLTFESEWLLIVAIYTWLPPARYVVLLTTLVIMLHSFLIWFCVILSLIKTLGVTFGNYCRVYSFTIYIKNMMYHWYCIPHKCPALFVFAECGCCSISNDLYCSYGDFSERFSMFFSMMFTSCKSL